MKQMHEGITEPLNKVLRDVTEIKEVPQHIIAAAQL